MGGRGKRRMRRGERKGRKEKGGDGLKEKGRG